MDELNQEDHEKEEETNDGIQNDQNWRKENSEKKSFENPNQGQGFTNPRENSGVTEQWRTSKTENRFFGERSNTYKKLDKRNESWRSDRSAMSTFDDKSSTFHGSKSTKQPPVKKNKMFDITELVTRHPDELVIFLVENLTDFTEFLAPPLPTNIVVQLTFLMEKVCESKTNIKLSTAILSRLQENFMKQLEKYLLKLSLAEEHDKADNDLFWNNPESFWKTLLCVFENIIDRLQKASTVYLENVIKTSLITILFHKNSHEINLEESIPKKLNSLHSRLKNLKKITNQPENETEENYYRMSVYPDPEELLTRKKPFLRQNIIDGSYMNVEHYLDIHFRLLREDFLAPLREAICTYKESLKNKEFVNITEFRVYPNTHFADNYDKWVNDYEGGFSLIGSIGSRIRRRSSRMLRPGQCNKKYVNHEEAFMPGGLLCFSSDNFETMFFGITTKVPGTINGIIDVQLLEEVPFLQDTAYTMLECCNYYSPYAMVLKSLKKFNSYNFPMKKYIIDVENYPQAPEYLTTSTQFIIKNVKCTVLDDLTWPSKEKLNLNKMQYDAFKKALQSECAVIQGPPGTGKTHLGLRIAGTLIRNNTPRSYLFSEDYYYSDDDEKYKRYQVDDFDDPKLKLRRFILRRLNLSRRSVHGPILIVAYTNHALDQFLEGLLRYTDNIVRIGHQSKNEKIKQFIFPGSKRNGDTLLEYYNEISEELTHKYKLLDELEDVLLYRGIFNLKLGITNFRFRDWSNERIVMWLLGANSTEKERQDRWEMANEIGKNFGSHKTPIPPQTVSRSGSNYILLVSDLKKIAEELERKLQNKNAINIENLFENWEDAEKSYKEIQDNIQYLEWRLRNAAEHVNLYKQNPIDATGDLMELSDNDRWILYFHWLDSYIQNRKKMLKYNTSYLQQIWDALEEYKQRADSELIGKAAVVGMTTSGAAKHRHLLEKLESRIVIVEEAAEVLESHILVCLTRHCQHLILIGDHQQLRPSTSDYQIEKQYQLGISLFERLIRNNISYNTLNIQHRMRPEIARLIVPAIYENLENHPSVSDFPPIHGIKQNVFFINHPYPEVEIGNSRKNPHEVRYLISLARHLILQGNSASQITILTTYKGQMYAIIDELKNNNIPPVTEVQVNVVDNFQGEENQIILLSLVRSNNQGSIGFLRIENRVCVTLSRAKKGFYMIGNMEILKSNSKIWPKINDVLEKNGQIGTGLELACQLHPQHVTIAVNPEDFLKVPDGGCHLPCNTTLECGHICKRKCHVTDLNHKTYLCMESCVRILCLESHQCPKKCYKRCGSCKILIEKSLPCGHDQMVPCSTKIEEYQCPVLIETVLKCNHIANKPCFIDKYDLKCLVEVEAVNPRCGHIFKKKCYESVDARFCNAVVIVKLSCGHDSESPCMLKNILLRKTCTKMCKKQLECGHICEKLCHYPKDRGHSTPDFRCKLKCPKLKVGCKTNHRCDLSCSELCQPCRNNVNIDLPCGHSKTVPCQKSDRKYTCDYPTKKANPCGHISYGKCQIISDSRCFYKVSKRFPNCGHTIKIHCSEDIQGKKCTRCMKK